MQLFAREAPVWAVALFNSLKAQKNSSITIILYEDDISGGTAAIAPCCFCVNVAKREMMAQLPHTWTTIADECREHWIPRNDADLFASLDSMADLSNRDRKIKEKALGFAWNPHGLTSNKEQRDKMPPSLSGNEVLHDYFANGWGSWECAQLVEVLAQENLDLATIQQDLMGEGWRRCGEGNHFHPGTLRRILHTKCWDKDKYKGDGDECHSLVYLLNWVQWRHFAGPRPEQASFQCLAEVCREIRSLSYQTKPVAAADLQKLRTLQRQHLKLYKQAYGEAQIRPKHHHSLHICDTAERLQMLPHVGIQEKTHSELKSALLDWCEGSLGDAFLIQKVLIPRLLRQSADSMVQHGLGIWGLSKKTKPAPKDMQEQLGDQNLHMSAEAHCFSRGIMQGDVLMYGDIAGQITAAVFGPSAGFFLCLEKLRLLERKPWGSLWASAHTRLWLKPDAKIRFTLAAWWKKSQEVHTCLH